MRIPLCRSSFVWLIYDWTNSLYVPSSFVIQFTLCELPAIKHQIYAFSIYSTKQIDHLPSYSGLYLVYNYLWFYKPTETTEMASTDTQIMAIRQSSPNPSRIALSWKGRVKLPFTVYLLVLSPTYSWFFFQNQKYNRTSNFCMIFKTFLLHL